MGRGEFRVLREEKKWGRKDCEFKMVGFRKFVVVWVGSGFGEFFVFW